MDTSSSAFGIKDFMVTVLIYLRAEIIFAFGSLHPLAGKLQPSIYGVSISVAAPLFSPFKTKGNSSFPAVFLWRASQIKILRLFVCFISNQDYSLCLFLSLSPRPNPQPVSPLCYFLCHLARLFPSLRLPLRCPSLITTILYRDLSL